jgi:hypothetical protein
MDIEDHQMDVQQPHNSDGSPNVSFIKAYPKQASAIFSDDDIKKTLRS